MPEKVTASTYLVLVPDIYSWGSSQYVRGIRVDRIRSAKPSLKSGEIAVRVRLNFNKQALIDSIPVVDLDVSSFLSGPSKAEPTSAEVVDE